jgi:hypothetical protein
VCFVNKSRRYFILELSLTQFVYFIERAKAIIQRSDKRVERCTDKFYLDEEPKDEMIMIKYYVIFMNGHSRHLKELKI